MNVTIITTGLMMLTSNLPTFKLHMHINKILYTSEIALITINYISDICICFSLFIYKSVIFYSSSKAQNSI